MGLPLEGADCVPWLSNEGSLNTISTLHNCCITFTEPGDLEHSHLFPGDY